LDSGGHGEIGSPTDADRQPEFFKEHEEELDKTTSSETFLATSQPIAVSNGQVTSG